MAGIVSGFLPILQGWVFILAGLTVMAPESRRATRVLHWAREKVGLLHHKKTVPVAAAPAGRDAATRNPRCGSSLPPEASGNSPLAG